MSIVWTTWKLTLWRYRYRELLAIGFFFVAGLAAVAHAGEFDPDERLRIFFDGPLYMVLIMFPFLSGVLPGVHSHERELTGRPMSFCLPGYRQSLRRLSFSAALPWGLFFALIEVPFLWRRGLLPRLGSPAITDVCLCLGGAFLVGVAVGWAANTSRLILSRLQWGIVALACSPLVVISIGVWLLADIHRPSFWVVAGLVAMIVIVFLWLRLGDMQYVARGHRIIIEDALDKRAQVGVTRTAPDWTDDLFLSWARQHPPLGVQRYVWASLYATFGGVFSYWLWILAGLVAGSVVLGLAPRPVAEIAFASLGFAAVFVDLPATSNMLLPGGRHERYYATVIATVVTTLLLLILAVGIAALSETIGIGLGAGAESFGFRFHSVWLVCVFVPWIVTLQLCGRRFRRIENRTPAIAVGLASLMVLRLFFAIHRWPAQKCLLFFAGVFVCGWAFFLLTTGHLCVGGSLVERRLGAGG